jgi:hypothetical protein
MKALERHASRAIVLASFGERMISLIRFHVGECPGCSSALWEMPLLVADLDAQLLAASVR